VCTHEGTVAGYERAAQINNTTGWGFMVIAASVKDGGNECQRERASGQRNDPFLKTKLRGGVELCEEGGVGFFRVKGTFYTRRNARAIFGSKKLHPWLVQRKKKEVLVSHRKEKK